MHSWYRLLPSAYAILQLLEGGCLFGQEAKRLFGPRANPAGRRRKSLRLSASPRRRWTRPPPHRCRFV